jgi:hypothetical protein
MAELVGKRFESPDEVREFTDGKGRVDLVDLNGHAVGLGTFEPDWRCSQNVKPIAGTDSCQVRANRLRHSRPHGAQDGRRH